MSNIFSFTDLWNSVATVFTGIGLNVTDTSSAASSKLLDLQKNGVSQITVDKNGNQTLAGNLTVGGLLFQSAQVGIVAGTTRTQAGSTVLTKEISRVDTATAPTAGTTLGDGVQLMASVAGLDASVINNTAFNIMVYPNGSETINNFGAGAGIIVPPGDVAQFESAVAGSWYVEAGVGSSGQYDTVIACDTISAPGTTQGTAGALTAIINRVTSGTGGVRLPASAAGLDIIIMNNSGGPINIYGSGSDTIDGLAASAPVAQMNGSLCLFACASIGSWFSNGIGTGYAGAYPTVSYTNGVTAFATGGQASGTLLTTALNRVTTVATANDSVKLPVAVAGMQITVFNAATNSLNVFPGVGDGINVLGANAAYGLTAGKTVTFFSTVAGNWHALLSA